ncbi:hypothetical protein [Lysobacter gummosus]
MPLRSSVRSLNPSDFMSICTCVASGKARLRSSSMRDSSPT